ncbi:MAG: YqaA family protein [Candidatus Rifleibacteriota bacterium]
MSDHNRKKSNFLTDFLSGNSAKYSAYALIVFLAGLFFLFYRYREIIKHSAENAVNTFGYPALFLICWAADVIIQPIPADVIVFGSAFGGADLFKTAIVAGMSSGMGGMTGYYIGRWFGPWRFRRIFGSAMLRKGRDLFRDHGALAIFVAGVSPIPYSAVCWIGGIYSMSLFKVVIASLVSRTLRYLLVAYLGHLA